MILTVVAIVAFFGIAWLLFVLRERHDARRELLRRERELALQRLRSTFGNARPPSPAFSRKPAPRRPAPQVRRPATGAQPRVRCEKCKRMVSLNKSGTLRVHADPHSSTTGYRRTCPGSSKRYVSIIIRENPYE